MKRLLASCVAASLGLFLCGAGFAAGPALVFRDDFENGADHWRPTDEDAWRVAATPEGKVYELFKSSNYKPPYRSPLNFALLRDVYLGDFVLEAKIKSTARDYDHRDLCLVFGYVDPAHFYYVHFGKKADDHANQVFIVNDAARKKISTESTPGTAWTNDWHQVKLVRKIEDGAIEVYFDDLEKPVMRANDKTFVKGRIGIGSFDDTGQFDDIRIHGKLLAPGQK